MRRPAKKPWLACVLSLVVPGLGLAYLRMWKAAVLNFVLAQCVVLGALSLRDSTINEHFHYVVLAILGVSAGAAHASALRLQKVVDATD